jgi:hypothetical protein
MNQLNPDPRLTAVRRQVEHELQRKADPTVSALVRGAVEARAAHTLTQSYQPGVAPNRQILNDNPDAGSNIHHAGTTR